MKEQFLEDYQYRLFAKLLGWEQADRWPQLAVDEEGRVWNLNTCQRMKEAMVCVGNPVKLVEFDCGSRARVVVGEYSPNERRFWVDYARRERKPVEAVKPEDVPKEKTLRLRRSNPLRRGRPFRHVC